MAVAVALRVAPPGGGANQPTHPGTYSYAPFDTPRPDIQPFAGPPVRPIEYAPFRPRPTLFEPIAGYEPFVAPTPESLLDDPGYQFRRSEGLNSVLHSAASRGLSRGGSALKALDRYGQGHASDEYDKAFGRAVTTHGTYGLDEYGAGRQEALDQYGSDVGAFTRAVTTHGLGRDTCARPARRRRRRAWPELNEYLVNTGNLADQWNRSLTGWGANNQAGLAGYQANTGAFDQYWASAPAAIRH